jgi:hypothetical protein
MGDWFLAPKRKLQKEKEEGKEKRGRKTVALWLERRPKQGKVAQDISREQFTRRFNGHIGGTCG